MTDKKTNFENTIEEAAESAKDAISNIKGKDIENSINEAANSAKDAISSIERKDIENSIDEAAVSAKEAISKLRPRAEKSGTVALLLCFFLGVWGVHRFYSGHVAIGLIQLFTFGGCGIWALIDLIVLLTGSYTDSDGNSMKL
tara:strand:- start:142 stop:570 length:429 start_codon:yes stop_codon:yes gene_type:complete